MRDLFRPTRRAAVAATLLVALLLAGFGAMIDAAQRHSREGLEDRFRLRATLVARFVQSFVNDTARQQRAAAQARLADARVSRREFDAVVHRFGFEAALLIDSRGRVIDVFPHDRRLVGTQIADRYAHLRGALSGRTTVSDVVPSAVQRTPIVAVAVPFRSERGLRVFSGAFPVEASPLDEFLRSSLPIKFGFARLYDGKGALIAGWGERRVGAFIARTTLAGTSWQVELGAPRAELLAPVSGVSSWAPWVLFAALALAAAALLLLLLQLVATNAKVRERNREVTRLLTVQQGFVATTSHELRNPLTSVLGFLDVILKGKAGPVESQQRDLLEVVHRNAGRMLDLVSDLLVAAQLDSGKLELRPERITLDEVVRAEVENVSPAAEEKGVELVLDTPGAAPVDADRARLAQVVGNLVSNAVKFTPREGRVEVRTFRENGHGVVEVSDTGIGIPAEEQERLFQRFFRASTAFDHDIPGTGLGLAIAHSITELHGGRLLCTSTEGAGSTFRLELPSSE